MADELATTEEQKRVRLLLKRRMQIELWGYFFLLAVPITLFGSSSFWSPSFPLRMLLLLCLFGGILPFYYYRLRRYYRQLSAEDIALIENNPISTTKREQQQIRGFIMANLAYTARKNYAEKELLRSSQQSQDETLLRAATPTDTTPQEQLLRPSPIDET